jgi:hypothetical protein
MKQLVLISLLFLFFAQCKKGDGKMCTEEFRIITVSLESQTGQALIPDSYYVVHWPLRDTLITHENTYGTGPISSEIILLTDNEMSFTNESGILFKLTAYIDGVKRVDESYLIRNDGCHIELVIGNTAITVDEP